MGIDGEMSMRLFIGGMRGSQPSIGAAFKEFGGDTTCLLLVGSQGDRLVLDAGTGMRTVAGQLAQAGPGEVTVLFSHYHLDHVIGLTMNPLFYKSDWSFNFVGPTFADVGVRDAVKLLLAPPYWPVSWEQMSARFEFTDFATDEIHVGRFRVRKCQVPHPGGCLAYRIDESGCDTSLVFATDLEWRSRTDAHETAFMAMCREPKQPDALVIDAHFARADEEAFTGWGHSCWQDCLEIAESAGVEQVILGHHAPDADDKTLLARERQVKKRTANGVLARAGQWFTIGTNEHKVQSC
jgi:ribonuclease BN (tRNA processing enzyme)